MSDVIKMSGRLLIFDKLNRNGIVFPKECKISFPEKIPVVWQFINYDPSMVLGTANISNDEQGLICDAEIVDSYLNRDMLHKMTIKREDT